MNPTADPFAPPVERTAATPRRSTLWGMVSRFPVPGADGRDTLVDVETSHWTGRWSVSVDGAVVHAARNLGWHAHEAFVVAGRRIEITSRWYPLRPVRVTLDGRPHIDDLWPQLATLQLVGAALLVPIVGIMTAGLVSDVVRIAKVLAGE